MSRARTASKERSAGIRAPEAKVLRTFVSLVSRLPFVEQVLTLPGCEGLEIWTIVDADPPDFETNKQVYQAELDAMDAVPGALVLFRLINRREYSGESLDYVLPSADRIVWRRAD
jgi:hypothetical protein